MKLEYEKPSFSRRGQLALNVAGRMSVESLPPLLPPSDI